ncbi:MAG: DUF2127 domain-containing protein [Verrucomicrobiales bacterium]|nr:DUF2127 domain-containing protein [Verrucomicrobiales bacterium]
MQRKSKAPPKRAPTYCGIIVFKLLKGLLFVAVAITAYALSDNDLPEEFRRLLHWLRLNPERKFFSELTAQMAKLSEANVLWVGAGSLLYSLFSLVEGIGLIFHVSWAGWLAIGESLFFIPIEVYDLLRDFSRTVFVILVLNIIIATYLFRNRERLFRHHYQHQRHSD